MLELVISAKKELNIQVFDASSMSLDEGLPGWNLASH